ncbi:hypothetical protein PFISCL1PPCAC_4190, partial [Pristionchus fissidentatus]
TARPSTSADAPPARRAFPSAFAPKPIETAPQPAASSPSPVSPAATTPSPVAPAASPPPPAAAPTQVPTPAPPVPKLLCPYETAGGGRHEISFGEFHLHLINCRRRHFAPNPDMVEMIRCPYNGTHYIPAPELALHERLCRDDRRALLEDQMSTEPTPIATTSDEEDEDEEESDDDYEKVEMAEAREHVEVRETREAEKEAEVGGVEEYGRVVDDLVQF